jgi:hypothetical protein
MTLPRFRKHRREKHTEHQMHEPVIGIALTARQAAKRISGQ